MAAFIRSASEGPPNNAESISGVRPRLGAAAAPVVVVEGGGGAFGSVVEFWRLHFRRLFIWASMIVVDVQRASDSREEGN